MYAYLYEQSYVHTLVRPGIPAVLPDNFLSSLGQLLGLLNRCHINLSRTRQRVSLCNNLYTPSSPVVFYSLPDLWRLLVDAHLPFLAVVG